MIVFLHTPQLFAQGDSISVLIDNLGSKDIDVRKSAIIPLCKIHDDRAFNALINSMHYDESMEIRLDIIVQMGRNKEQRAIDALVKMMNNEIDSDYGICATEALCKIGGDVVVDNMIKRLKNKNNWGVRVAIIHSLGIL